MPEIKETRLYAELTDVIRLDDRMPSDQMCDEDLLLLGLDRKQLISRAQRALVAARHRRPHFDSEGSWAYPGNE